VAIVAQQQTALVVDAQGELVPLFEVTDRAPHVVYGHLTRRYVTHILGARDPRQDETQQP
jgi:hypothetical protein